MTDIGRAGMVPKGDYNPANTYEILDVVSSENALYVAKQNVPVNTPPSNSAYWQQAIIGRVSYGAFTRNGATASYILSIKDSTYHNGCVLCITSGRDAWSDSFSAVFLVVCNNDSPLNPPSLIGIAGSYNKFSVSRDDNQRIIITATSPNGQNVTGLGIASIRVDDETS